MAAKICFCYAREDEPLLKKLKAHLRPMQREGLIETWYDRDISPGTEWGKAIKEQLETADIILLLISSDFMDSDYCYSTEMQQALERHNSGNARVIPIIFRPVYWQGTLGRLQALPTDGVAVTDPQWHNLDRALYNVAEGIRTIVVKELIQQYLADADDLSSIEEKYQEAIALCEKVISLKISCSEAYAGKGYALFYLGQYEDASAAYNQAIFYDSHQGNYYAWKVKTLLKLGRYEEALACSDKAISLEPARSGYYLDKGRILGELKRYEDALTIYEKAISFDAKDSYAYYRKGDVLSKLDRYEEALIAFDTSILLDVTDEETLSKKGAILQMLNREEEALAAFEEAIKLNPEYIDGYLGKGSILLSGKTYNMFVKNEEYFFDALNAYEKVIEIDPDSVLAWQGKGIALLLLNRHEEALIAFTRAVEIDPTDKLTWHHEAIAHEQLAQQSHKKAKQLGYRPVMSEEPLDTTSLMQSEQYNAIADIVAPVSSTMLYILWEK